MSARLRGRPFWKDVDGQIEKADLTRSFAWGQNLGRRRKDGLKLASASDDPAAHVAELEMNGERLKPIEVPPCLDLAHYLDITERDPE